MADRDVETIRSRAKFVATLRRVADALENERPVRIQVASKRFIVPADAELSVEHEVEGGAEELELQLKWQSVEDDAPQPKAARVGRAKTRGGTGGRKKAGRKKAGRKKAGRKKAGQKKAGQKKAARRKPG